VLAQFRIMPGKRWTGVLVVLERLDDGTYAVEHQPHEERGPRDSGMDRAQPKRGVR